MDATWCQNLENLKLYILPTSSIYQSMSVLRINKTLEHISNRFSRGQRCFNYWNIVCHCGSSSSHYEAGEHCQEIFDALKECSWIELEDGIVRFPRLKTGQTLEKLEKIASQKS